MGVFGMSYYDGFTPGYTFRLSIEREDRTLLDAAVAAKGEAEAIGKAKRSIQRLLNEYTPKVESAAVPVPEFEPVEPEPEEKPEEPVDGAALEPEISEEPKRKNSPVTTFITGIKGSVFLECPVCGKRFHACFREDTQSVPCNCGHMIDLTAPTFARYEYNCLSCGRHNYGKTNIEGAEYSDFCQCGKIIKLRWDQKNRKYMGFMPRRQGNENASTLQ